MNLQHYTDITKSGGLAETNAGATGRRLMAPVTLTLEVIS
jgi:hypothetical protein